MALGEFELIDRYFTRPPRRREVVLGVGDDCALLRPSPGMELAVSIDTLVAGVHFPPDTAPRDVGHKALAVGLSDLAAMGAEPAWATLALTLPAAEDAWLAEFAAGFFALAERHDLDLIGGDTVRGPLSVTVQVHGLVPEGAALRRAGARAGDWVYVSGELGGAAFALGQRLGDWDLDGAEALAPRLDRPEPRVALGLALRGLASACIDLSDGLAADLGHIAAASGLAAELFAETIPMPAALTAGMAPEAALKLALSGGDDYELCFAVPPERVAAVPAPGRCGTPLYRVGRMRPGAGVRVLDGAGRVLHTGAGGHQHFQPQADPTQ